MRMNHKNIVLNKSSQTQDHVIPFIGLSRIGKCVETKTRLVGARHRGPERAE